MAASRSTGFVVALLLGMRHVVDIDFSPPDMCSCAAAGAGPLIPIPSFVSTCRHRCDSTFPDASVICRPIPLADSFQDEPVVVVVIGFHVALLAGVREV
jgi:hypothetical protein